MGWVFRLNPRFKKNKVFHRPNARPPVYTGIVKVTYSTIPTVNVRVEPFRSRIQTEPWYSLCEAEIQRYNNPFNLRIFSNISQKFKERPQRPQGVLLHSGHIKNWVERVLGKALKPKKERIGPGKMQLVWNNDTRGLQQEMRHINSPVCP